MPAPAPCATTQQANGRAGTRKRPETVWVPSTVIVNVPLTVLIRYVQAGFIGRNASDAGNVPTAV